MSIISKLLGNGTFPGAERVLESRRKLEDAITRETAKLQALSLDRLAEEKAITDAETEMAVEALDLLAPAETSVGREHLNGILLAIERQGSLLAGLRSRLAALAQDLEAERRSVADALPAHMARAKSEFEKEWAKAIESFAVLLGKRKALELRLGKLSLAEPAAVNCELPQETEAPWRILQELGGALKEIGYLGNRGGLAGARCTNGINCNAIRSEGCLCRFASDGWSGSRQLRNGGMLRAWRVVSFRVD